MNDGSTRVWTEPVTIMVLSASMYALVEYSSHAFRFPSPFIPQTLLAPAIPLNIVFGGMLDVDADGIANIVRALVFSVIALGGIIPFTRYRKTRRGTYLALSIALWVWYILSVSGVCFLYWAMNNSGWTD